jgi:hypothetical protein
MATSVIGFYALLVPREGGLETVLGWITLIWALMLLTSVPAAVSALYERYRIEYVLLPLFTTALFAAVVYTWFNVSGDMTTIPRAATSTALVFCFLVRFALLNRLILPEGRRPWIPKRYA